VTSIGILASFLSRLNIPGGAGSHVFSKIAGLATIG